MYEEILTDDSIMPFGIHKGEKLIDVPATYLLRLENQKWLRQNLKNYINKERAWLEQQAKNERKK